MPGWCLGTLLSRGPLLGIFGWELGAEPSSPAPPPLGFHLVLFAAALEAHDGIKRD